MKPIIIITTICSIQTKKRALALADYMAECGIDVIEVKISTDGNSTIDCVDTHNEIINIINQFNEDYNE